MGDGLVLNAVRPTPKGLPVPKFRKILDLRLGQQNDVVPGDELLPGPQPTHKPGECAVRNTKAFAVTIFKVEPLAQFRSNALKMLRVDR